MRDLAHSLSASLLEAFPPDRTYSAARLEQPPMPPAVAHYLHHILQQRTREEADRLRAARTSWFDYDHPDVRRAAGAYLETVADHAHIPPDAWSALVRQAVSQVYAFLSRPRQTLVAFVFESHDAPRPASVVQQRMAYFDAYGYFRDVVDGYLAQKKVAELDRGRFGDLLARIDGQMTDGYTPEDWVRLLAPLFDFCRSAQRVSDAVPVSALHAFFTEKQAYDLVHLLDASGARELDREALLELLTGAVPPVEEEFEPDDEPIWQAPPPRKAPAETPRETARETAREVPAGRPAAPAPAGADDAVPLWKRFQQGPQQAPPPGASQHGPAQQGPLHHGPVPQGPVPQGPARPQSPPPAERRPAPERSTAAPGAVPLWKQFASDRPSPAGSASPRPRPTSEPHRAPALHHTAEPSAHRSQELEVLEEQVLGSRGLREREHFIAQLFSGSRGDYEETLRKLSQAETWTQASHIIAQDVFRKHQVNIYSEPAVAFTDLVESGYRG